MAIVKEARVASCILLLVATASVVLGRSGGRNTVHPCRYKGNYKDKYKDKNYEKYKDKYKAKECRAPCLLLVADDQPKDKY